MKYDYLIIGSGISGLVSAIIMAQQGFRVAVVEKADHPAPLLRGFRRKGIHFDTGFHYTGSLARGECLDTYFRYLGIAKDLHPVAYDADCFDALHFPQDDYTFHFPYGYDRLRQRLHTAFPHEKQGIDSYLRIVAEEFNRSPHLNLELPPDALGAFSSFSETSVSSYLKDLFRDPRLRAVLSIHYLLYGAEPNHASVSLHAQVCGSLYQSVHGLEGGGKALAESLVRRVQSLGAKLYAGQGVSRIIAPSGSFHGLELDNGDMLEASGCISSIHPAALLSIVDEAAFRPVTRRRMQAYEDTSSGFMFSAAIEELPTLLDRKNFFICPDMNPDTYCRIDRPIENRPFFLAAAGPASGSTAHGLIMLCPASLREMRAWQDTAANRRPKSYLDLKRELMDRVQAHILRTVPALSGLTMLDCATPLTFRDYTNTPSGSLYGIKQKHGQIPPSPLSKIKGLFLTGQALAGPGILGGTISAFVTCGFILGHQSLRSEVQKCR